MKKAAYQYLPDNEAQGLNQDLLYPAWTEGNKMYLKRQKIY
jgi:hypothetical protein